jgi:hypothetical protein
VGIDLRACLVREKVGLGGAKNLLLLRGDRLFLRGNFLSFGITIFDNLAMAPEAIGRKGKCALERSSKRYERLQ